MRNLEVPQITFLRRLIISLFLLILCLSTKLEAQTLGNDPVISGYSKTTHGGGFEYHSPQPGVRSSMLIRSLSSVDYIEWKTFPVPDIKEDSISFIMMFGMDANPDFHHWKLSINGNEIVEFSNPIESELKTWSVNGKDGSVLTFRATMLDKFNDPMGYAILKVPKKLVKTGQEQTIQVTGENAGSRTWFMVFEAPVTEDAGVQQVNALIKVGNKLKAVVNFTVNHPGESCDGEIIIDGVINKNIRIEPGFNLYEVLLPPEKKSRAYTATVTIGKKSPQEMVFVIKPVKEWTIFLVQHAHTDIGYTRPQTEILPEHLKYIDLALDYCDATDNLPPEAQFHWTCETSWAVGEYLKSRPQKQIDRLKKRVAEGRIEIAGLYLNMSELYSESLLAESFEPLKQLSKMGLHAEVAMQNDVNGVPWCLADYMNSAGIKYYSMAQNTHRARKPFDVPTLFWWESPSGKRVLTLRNEHYMTGNFLGILNHEISSFEKSLFPLLDDLDKKGFAMDAIPFQFSGFLTDNSPPSTTACNIVKLWNEKYVWPKLQLSTMSDFFKYAETRFAAKAPVFRKAWPDWWSDGFGSTAIETAYARNTQSDFENNQSLLALAALQGVSIPANAYNLCEEISNNLIFWNEHTFTAAESISDPLAENTIIQWGQKAAWVWTAVKQNSMLRDQALALMADYMPQSKEPTIVVFNMKSYPRSGIAEVFINQQILPRDKSFTIVDEEGNEVHCQMLRHREEGAYWAVECSEMKGFSYKIFRIRVKNETTVLTPVIPSKDVLENDFYLINIDGQSGAITGIYDKELKMELVGTDKEWGFGQIIYERLGNRNQLEQLRLDDYTRNAWNNISVSGLTKGPAWNSITVSGEVAGCALPGSASYEIRLFHHEKKIELHYAMKKLQVTDPEAVYVAFPFAGNNRRLRFDVQGGIVYPGINQMEGSSSDWNTIQKTVSAVEEGSQILWATPEIPLVQLGAINLGRFSRLATVNKPTIFSWVLNNYWTTNFLASQQGELKWSYVITSSADTSVGFMNKFGESATSGLAAFVRPAYPVISQVIQLKYPDLNFEGLSLISSRLGGNGSVFLHFREIEGRDHQVDLLSAFKNFPVQSVSEVNILGDKIADVKGSISIGKFEQRFFEVKVE